MKYLDIRIKKETDKKHAAAQLEMISKLTERLPARIAEEFSDVDVRIRLSSENGYNLSGFKDKDEKNKFLTFLEELWNDDSLVE